METPRNRALNACLDVAIRAGRLDFGLRAYERETGISSRMLAHHFGNNEGLELALLAAIEARLRDKVSLALQGGRTPLEIAADLHEGAHAALLDLLRPLLQRALGGNDAALALVREERQRWREKLSHAVAGQDVDQALFILVGAAVDAMLKAPPAIQSRSK